MPSTAKSVISSDDYVVNEYRAPVLSLEHRLLYDYSFAGDSLEETDPLTSFLTREGDAVTIVAASIMVQEAERAADFVRKKEGIEVEIIDLHCVSHPDVKRILSSVKKTGRLIVADTGWAAFGVCAEVSRMVATTDPSILKRPVINLSMAQTTCPTPRPWKSIFILTSATWWTPSTPWCSRALIMVSPCLQRNSRPLSTRSSRGHFNDL